MLKKGATEQLKTGNYIEDAVSTIMPHVTKPVNIGTGTWIGAESIILGKKSLPSAYLQLVR